jgi:2,4-dienoyl-CoA reductase-like NADH-dependent reductase (Old Yellow Enzyme family)
VVCKPGGDPGLVNGYSALQDRPAMIESPLTLPNGLALKNRVAKAAMTENIADPVDGDPSCEVRRGQSHHAGEPPGPTIELVHHA